MKVRDFRREAERAGWRLVRQRGSHHIYERSGERVLLAGVPQLEIGPVRLRQWRRRLGLER